MKDNNKIKFLKKYKKNSLVKNTIIYILVGVTLFFVFCWVNNLLDLLKNGGNEKILAISSIVLIFILIAILLYAYVIQKIPEKIRKSNIIKKIHVIRISQLISIILGLIFIYIIVHINIKSKDLVLSFVIMTSIIFIFISMLIYIFNIFKEEDLKNELIKKIDNMTENEFKQYMKNYFQNKEFLIISIDKNSKYKNLVDFILVKDDIKILVLISQYSRYYDLNEINECLNYFKANKVLLIINSNICPKYTKICEIDNYDYSYNSSGYIIDQYSVDPKYKYDSHNWEIKKWCTDIYRLWDRKFLIHKFSDELKKHENYLWNII